MYFNVLLLIERKLSKYLFIYFLISEMKKKRTQTNSVLEIVRDKNSLDQLPCVWKGSEGVLCSAPFFVIWLACASLPCGLS